MVEDTVTAVDGNYTFTIADAASDEICVEFLIDDDHLDHRGIGVVAATVTGATNSTFGARVQFAFIGAINVNVGVSRPDKKCGAEAFAPAPHIALRFKCRSTSQTRAGEDAGLQPQLRGSSCRRSRFR